MIINSQKIKLQIAPVILLATILLGFAACDGLKAPTKNDEEANAGMLLAVLSLGGGNPAPQNTAVQPDPTIVTWADLSAKVSCGGCHGRTPVFNAGAFQTFAGVANCTANGYTSSPLYKQLLPGRIMYNYDPAISNNAIPYVAGWIANGCRDL